MASSSSSPPLYDMYDNNSDGSYNNNSPFNQVKYTLNSRIMVAAIIVLFVVIVFVVSLHVYAKWFWRHTSALSGNHNRRSRRSRGRLHFVIEDPPFVASQQHQHRVLGLEKSVIDSLPTFAYMPLKEGPDADKNGAVYLCECAVCLCEFEENEKCRLLPDCKHSFHIECIDMWFQSHATCPLCRTPVLPHGHKLHEDDLNSSIPVLPDLDHSSESNPNPDSAGQRTRRMPSFGTSQHPTTSSCGRHGNTASARSLSHICIDVSGGSVPPEAVPIPRCFSLSLSRFPSHRLVSGEDIYGCSAGPSSSSNTAQNLKSPSFRVSIKRLLSLDRSRARSRIFPSGQDSSSSAVVTQDNNISRSNSSV